jgi:hypothetical protein
MWLPMTNDGPKRPKHKGRQAPPPIDPDLASAIMDSLAQHPEITRAFNQLLKEEGRALDDIIPEAAARIYHALGVPVPPELKDYLREHLNELMPDTRKRILGCDLN